VLLPTLFFSLSQSKRPGYILPVMPAVALLCARVLQASPRTLRTAVWVSAPIAAAVGAVLIVAGDFASSLIRDAPGVEGILRATAPYLGAGLMGTAGLAFLGLRRHRVGLLGLTLMPLVLVLGAQGALVALGEQRSARELAEAIRDVTHGQGRVVSLLAYPPSLSFYLEQPVLLATYNASEVRSNYINEYRSVLLEAPDSTLRPLSWWPEETGRCPPQTVFILNTRRGWERERAELAAKLPLIYRNHKYEAYGPCPGGYN
jgi:4-amino-4-deoxy-L-arabinose transferase-like glycosyltransferase